MQRTLVGFEASYRRHLAVEQRRAVLDALAQSFDDESTVGQIVDAAAALGYVGLGDLSLADLADALLTDARAGHGAAAPVEDDDADADEDDAAEDDEDADDDEADDDEDDEDEEAAEEAPAAKARGRAAVVKAKPATKAATKAKPSKAAPPAKAAAKPAGKGGKPPKISLDDRMSLAEAADVLLPLVRALDQATMQQLEQSTAGAGRRKLRFHIGQLVRNGHLERHGMGRGTYYTVAK